MTKWYWNQYRSWANTMSEFKVDLILALEFFVEHLGTAQFALTHAPPGGDSQQEIIGKIMES